MVIFTAISLTGVAVAGYFSVTLVAGTFSAFALGLASQVVLGLALNALTPKPSIPSRSAARRGYTVNSLGSALDHQVIYGEMKVGGAIVFDYTTGINNKFLHRIVAYAGHEIEEFKEIYINDELVTIGSALDYSVTLTTNPEDRKSDRVTTLDIKVVPTSYTEYNVSDNLSRSELEGLLAAAENSSALDQYNALKQDSFISSVVSTKTLNNNIVEGKYAEVIRIYEHLGSPNQPADANLVSAVGKNKWSDRHTLSGIAYLYIRLAFDAELFPNGIPRITSVIKGKKVYDPRSDTTAWSSNPALCLRDYLTSTSYGMGEESTSVDDDIISIAANVCDFSNYPTLSGSPKYTCNGAFTTAVTPYDLLGDLASSMGGMVWYGQGKWRMKPGYYTAPTASLGNDDLRSSISVNTRHSRRDNFNIVKGTFKGEESLWQITDYPQVTNPAFVAEDNDQESSIDLDLPYTSDSVIARRIARIALERNRQQLTISASFGLKAFQVQVGDIVTLTNPRFGWSSKEFEVTSWTFGLTDGYDLQTNLVLREISESVFDDVSDGIVYTRDNTSLLSPFDVPPLGLSVTSSLRLFNQRAVSVASVDITSSSPERVDTVELQYAVAGTNEWIQTPATTLGMAQILDLEEGKYDFRARAKNTFGIRGSFTYIFGYFVAPFVDPPQDVQNFTGNSVGPLLYLIWDAVPDLDLSHYRIRYSPKVTGASYQDSVDIVRRVARPSVSHTVPSKSGTYFIKAVDKSGISSLASSSFVLSTNISAFEDLNLIQTLTESPDFLGVKDGTVALDNDGDPYLTLDTIAFFDSTVGNFDDAEGLFDGGSSDNGVLTEGFYAFNNTIDLGATYLSRVSASSSVVFLDYINTFDSATGLFDDRDGDFDGDPSQFGNTSNAVNVSFTDDDPTGTPVWSDWQELVVSDISARAFRFRSVLTSTSNKTAPAVTSLSATVDMPDRVEDGSDITYTGTTNVTFDTPFYAVPSLGLSITLADGDRYEVSNKTRTGFTITTYTGVSVSTNSATFDYVAKGYGKEVT